MRRSRSWRTKRASPCDSAALAWRQRGRWHQAAGFLEDPEEERCPPWWRQADDEQLGRPYMDSKGSPPPPNPRGRGTIAGAREELGRVAPRMRGHMSSEQQPF
eukprot:g12833.t1